MAITGVERLFLDTNVLIRATLTTAPLHDDARHAVENAYTAGTELWISRQVLREYLAVLSRPQPYTAPLSPDMLRDDLVRFAATFRIADEDARVTQQLLVLLQQVPTGGRQVHDANIVATMMVYGVEHLLTHNTVDFARFAGYITVVPLTAAAY